ncbi:hypothetical protein Scep_001582 [Stephania cephalantha]|uniref:Uncharacterized protein n=1 Tax=Stephania cephalantha TaxID=152367 RepID=A0AAP0Q7W3_9MAGN
MVTFTLYEYFSNIIACTSLSLHIYWSCIHGHERKEAFEGPIVFIGYMCGRMNIVGLYDWSQ